MRHPSGTEPRVSCSNGTAEAAPAGRVRRQYIANGSARMVLQYCLPEDDDRITRRPGRSEQRLTEFVHPQGKARFLKVHQYRIAPFKKTASGPVVRLEPPPVNQAGGLHHLAARARPAAALVGTMGYSRADFVKRNVASQPRLCRPYRAMTKGKVECFNSYLKGSFVVPLTATVEATGPGLGGPTLPTFTLGAGWARSPTPACMRPRRPFQRCAWPRSAPSCWPRQRRGRDDRLPSACHLSGSSIR